MLLQNIELQNYRNYKKRKFEFSSSQTIFVGPNAIGKTNILEAVFMLATGKSMRASQDRETIRHGEELARIVAEMITKTVNDEGEIDTDINLQLIITGGLVQGQKAPLKKYLVNGVPRRMHDFAGTLKAVIFEPADVELVRASPSKKRAFLDFAISQTDRTYRRSLSLYEKGLRQRNKLLQQIRDEGASRALLEYWDQLLITNGSYITAKRTEFIEYLQNVKTPVKNFQVRYDHSHISVERLKQYEHEEVSAGTTLVGPHRDTFEIFDGERALAQFGSRGEQRLAVLWLKYSELKYIESVTFERPLLLLDDIFSELDPIHQAHIESFCEGRQVILTSADPESVNQIKDKIVINLQG